MNHFPLLLLIPALLHAQPGSLLPSDFPQCSSPATVFATSITDDGAIFLAGDFQEIDGTLRPKLAKLTPTGMLDLSFNPEPLPPASGLFALPTGHLMHLMHLGPASWSLLNPDASHNTTLLSGIPRTTVPSPQFHTPARVYLIIDNALRAYRSSDLVPDPTFVPPLTAHPPFQAVPAADSKVWLLTRSPAAAFFPTYYNSDLSHTLVRLLENGAIDPSFPARELPAEHAYSLESAPSGGFRLISEWLGRYNYWPRATSRANTAKHCSSAGEEIASFNYSTPFSWSAGALSHDPDLLIQPTLDSTRLVGRPTTSTSSDAAFTLDIASPETPILGPLGVRTLDALPSGKFLVGGTRGFLPDGSPDPTRHTPRLAKSPTISHLTRLPGGAILATGDFDLSEGSPAPGILKLLPDDSSDPTFTPAFDFRFAKKVLPFPDSTLLAHFTIPAVDPSGRASQLARFSATGGFLSLWPIPEPLGTAVLSFGEIIDFAIQSDGTTLVSTMNHSAVTTPGFRRILPDGTSPLVPGAFANSNTSGPLLLLHDDSYLRGNTHFAPDGTLLETLPTTLAPLVQIPDRSVIFARQSRFTSSPTLLKWHPLTGIDPTFIDPFKNQPNTHIVSIIPAAHQKLVVLLKNNSLVRLHATGQIDPTFRPPAANIHSVLAEPGGTLLIAGDFSTLDGQAHPGLARLADTRAVGYTEWIAASTARTTIIELAPEADPDHDGTSNFLEYAAATDPTTPTPSQPSRIGPFTWMIPCNPEAPEIIRRIETSSNLNTWTPARADQLRLETNRNCLTWTLFKDSSTLFSRVRID